MHSPFETSKSVRRSRPSVRSLQTMTRSKQVKDSGKNALTFRPRLLPRARFPSSKKAGKKTFVVFHKHAVPPPSLPLPLCALRIRSFVACPPGGILPRPTKRRKYTCLSSRARYSFWWAGRARGVRRRHDLCDCFRSPSPGLNYENGIVTFHSPSNSPAAERGGGKDIGRPAPREDERRSCFQRLITPLSLRL